MSGVQLTEDVIDIAVETIDKEIGRLTQAKAGLMKYREIEEALAAGRLATPVTVGAPANTPPAATRKAPRKKPVREQKATTKAKPKPTPKPAKPAPTLKKHKQPRYTVCQLDIVATLKAADKPLTEHSMRELLAVTNIKPSENMFKKVLGQAQAAGRVVLGDDGRWSLGEEEKS